MCNPNHSLSFFQQQVQGREMILDDAESDIDAMAWVTLCKLSTL